VDDTRRIGRLSVGSWILYDLANTSFSLAILTLYHPFLVKKVLGYSDSTVGNLEALAAGLVFIAFPILPPRGRSPA
jgi:UMF1 family MFS transporter